MFARASDSLIRLIVQNAAVFALLDTEREPRLMNDSCNSTS